MTGEGKHKTGLLGRTLAWFSRPAPEPDSVVLRRTRAPHRRRRFIFITLAVVAVLCLTPAIVAAYLFNRLGEGPIALGWMSSPLASGISARLGSSYSVDIGPIVLEDSDHGPRLAISGFTLKDEQGRAILVAPKAEAAVNPLPLIFGRIAPRRIEIQDVEVRLSVLPDGSVAVSAGLEPIVLTGQRRPGETAPDPATQPEDAPKTDVMAQLGAALRTMLDSATRPDSPIGALKRLGISRGRLVFDDQTARSLTVFDDLELHFDRTDHDAGLFLSANGPNGRWRIEASATGKPGEPRNLDVSLSNITLDEILLVAGTRDPGFDMTFPVSARLNVALAADGRVLGAGGRFYTGSGFLLLDDRDHEPMQVDAIEGTFDWMGDTRRFELGRTTLSLGETKFTVAGTLTPPTTGEAAWRIDGRTIERGLFGAERAGEKPVQVDRATFTGRVLTQERRLLVDRFEMAGPEMALSTSLDLQLTERGPHLRMNVNTGRMPAQSLIRIWPSVAASSVRSWFQRSLTSGMLEEGTLWLDFDPETMKTIDQRSPPDQSMRLTFRLSNTVLLAMPGLPPLAGISGTGVVTGRTANFIATRGLMQVTPAQRLNLVEGAFTAPDLDLKPMPATINLRMTGPLDAVADLFERDALKPYAQLPIDSTTVAGQIDGRMVIDLSLRENAPLEDTRVRASATLTNFSVDKLVGSEKLEAATLNVTAGRGTLQASGQGRLFGAPATIELRKSVNTPTEVTLGMQLDDAARTKLGLNFGPALTGQIGARMTAVLGQKDKPRAQVEIDFTRAAIDNLLPGYTKQAGRPAKASFTLVNDPDGPDLEQFVFDGGGGAMARGTIELDSSGALERAKLTQVRLSPGDDMRIDAEQAKDVLKLSISGKAVDAKPFLKLLTTGAPSGARDRSSPPKDFDLELKAGTVTGHNKQSASNVELKMGRRSGQIRQFQLTGRFGRDAVSGSMVRAAAGEPPQIALSTNDGGALLSFFDLYRRMEGGKLTFVASIEDNEIDGTVTVRDFIVRNEPALRRLVTEGVAARDRSGQVRIDTTAAAFTRMQVSFTRAQGRIELRDGVIYGPEAGTTITGTLDTLNDRVNMTGTFVPAYGVNNLFSKIPLFGVILGGGTNEGLFGVNFRISGPATAPVLTINPLSALAPGFLRKIFGAGEIGTSQMPQPAPAPAPAAPQPPAPLQYAPQRTPLR